MAIYDKASLVLIPSGTKTSKVYSQKPTNGDGDFTFSRSTAATRVNASGNIEKETQNLLTHSGDITNAIWVPSGLGYNGTETDPNGGSKAYSFISGSTNAYLRQNNTLSGGVYTFSVYLKSTTNISINIRLDSYNGTFINYPCALTTEWQRFEFFYVHNSSTLGAWIGGGLSWTTGEEVHIAFPQVEQGLVARDYIETTTTAIYGGITDNVPRLDYTDSSCPALLLEPQRSNLIPHSEYFGSADWSKQNSIGVNTNSHLSPEGIQNATELDGFDSSNFQSVTQYITLSDGTYTFSVFLKKTTGALTHYPAVVMGSIYKYVIINSTTGTYAEATGTNDNDSVTIESWDDNWWRVSLTNTLSAGAQRFAIYPSLSANGTSITTNASGTNIFFGAQLEAGSYPTSYIPTYGSAVTRNADAASKTGISSLIGQTEGTLFAEFEIKSTNTDNFNRIIAIGDGTSNNRIMIFANNDEKPRAFISDSGATQVSIIGNTSILGGTHKIAFAYKANDFVLYMDGVSLGTDTSGSVPSLSNIYLASAEDSNIRPIEGGLKQALVFKTRLSNEELATLTTI